MSKKERCDSKFNIIGAFWQPRRKKKVLKGILKAEDRVITFMTSPTYSRSIFPKEPQKLFRFTGGKELPRYPAFHGYTAQGECTLCDVIEADKEGVTDASLQRSIMATVYHASVCLFGLHLDGLSDKCLDSARYTFAGLNGWFPGSSTEQWTDKKIKVEIPLEATQIVKFVVPGNQTEVNIEIIAELASSEKDEHSRVFRSVASIQVKPKEKQSLTWVLDLGVRLENFFSLLTGASLSPETIFVYRGNESAYAVTRGHSYRGDLAG